MLRKELDMDYNLARGSKIKKIEVIDSFHEYSFIIVFDDRRIKIPGLKDIDTKMLDSFVGKYLNEFKEFLLSKKDIK